MISKTMFRHTPKPFLSKVFKTMPIYHPTEHKFRLANVRLYLLRLNFIAFRFSIGSIPFHLPKVLNTSTTLTRHFDAP